MSSGQQDALDIGLTVGGVLAEAARAFEY